jgi:hypothetical protein
VRAKRLVIGCDPTRTNLVNFALDSSARKAHYAFNSSERNNWLVGSLLVKTPSANKSAAKTTTIKPALRLPILVQIVALFFENLYFSLL